MKVSIKSNFNFKELLVVRYNAKSKFDVCIILSTMMAMTFADRGPWRLDMTSGTKVTAVIK